MTEYRKDLWLRAAWGVAAVTFAYWGVSTTWFGGYPWRGVEFFLALYFTLRAFSSIPATKFP